MRTCSKMPLSRRIMEHCDRRPPAVMQADLLMELGPCIASCATILACREPDGEPDVTYT